MFENLFSNSEILYQAGSSVAALVVACIGIKFVIRMVREAGKDYDVPSDGRSQEWWDKEAQRQWDRLYKD